MPEALSLAANNLLTPAVLFFALGLFAGLLRSDLAVPDAAAKTLALYLMLAIGFKGGVEASRAGLTADFFNAGATGVILSFIIPVVAFYALRSVARLDRTTAAATAAHYGSVSVVTFAAGTEYLRALGVPFGGYMVAVVALMETPAILTALLLAGGDAAGKQGLRGNLLREVLLNGSVVLLVGSFVIGAVTGERGMAKLDLFVNPLFQGVLALFLLDMGLVAARRLREAKTMTVPLVLFALSMPLVSCAMSIALSALLGVKPADAAVLAILAASASYIAVPAAMRIALPKADPGVYLTLSLGITFPFNLLIGIPLYQAVVATVLG
ncbi:MAG: sodium-dependent bicarbonate transport family permease [Alphaproteobacteria bacterium]|nr:sodium-dependent bicarbonate transport family permease [Alphaproteobacteria bacterium]